MATKKKGSESGVYRVTEIIGTSPNSWEDAAKIAVETAALSLRDLRVAEVNKLDMKIEGGKVVAFRAKVSLSFKYAGLTPPDFRDPCAVRERRLDEAGVRLGRAKRPSAPTA